MQISDIECVSTCRKSCCQSTRYRHFPVRSSRAAGGANRQGGAGWRTAETVLAHLEFSAELFDRRVFNELDRFGVLDVIVLDPAGVLRCGSLEHRVSY